MDEIREETEYERVVRKGHAQKYKRDFGPRWGYQQKNADMLPLFWIGFFGIMLLVLFYLGTHGG
jgi:hypothetical protein